MIRRAGLIIAFCFTAFGAEADFHFIGFYNDDDPKASYWCRERLYVEHPLNNRAEFQEIQRKFEEEHKKADAAAFMLVPGRCAVVYKYIRKFPAFKCNFLVHGIAFGDTVDLARESMDKHMADTAKERDGDCRVVFTWRGGGYLKTLTEQHGDLELTFRTVRTEAGRTSVILTALNKNKQKSAIIRLKTDDAAEIEPVRVGPGMRYTGKVLSSSGFSSAIRFEEPKESEIPLEPSAMDKLGGWVKNNFITSEGLVRRGPAYGRRSDLGGGRRH